MLFFAFFKNIIFLILCFKKIKFNYISAYFHEIIVLPRVKNCRPRPRVDGDDAVQRPNVPHLHTRGHLRPEPPQHEHMRQEVEHGKESRGGLLNTENANERPLPMKLGDIKPAS